MLAYFALAYVLVSVVVALAAVRAKNRAVPPHVRTSEDVEQMRALYLSDPRRSVRAFRSSVGTRGTHDPV